MEHKESRLLPLYAFIAKKWLRSSPYEAKKELIATKRFILKAERQHKHTGIGLDIISTFSVHTRYTSGDKTNWWYKKYLVDHDGNYTLLREGCYPYDWE